MEGRQVDLWDVTKVMWRRRWVAAPLALLTLIAAVFALFALDPQYQVVAQVMIKAPIDSAGDDGPKNPWNEYSIAEAIQIHLNRAELKPAFQEAGLSSNFVIGLGGHGLALIAIDVTAASPEQAAKTRDHVIALITGEISQRQEGIGEGKRFTGEVLDAGEVTTLRTAGKRTLIVLLAVGLIVTAAVSLWADALIRRRTGGAPRQPTGHGSAALPGATVQPAVAGKAGRAALGGAKRDAKSDEATPDTGGGLLSLSSISWDTPVTPTLPAHEVESESGGKVR